MVEEAPAGMADLVRRRFGAGATIGRFAPLAGDASTRRYGRAWLGGDGVPKTLVVMILADRGVSMSSDELAVFDEPPSELPYVNVHKFLVSIGVAVPELYVDASESGLLLLEDIGDVALWDAAQGSSRSEVKGLFEQAIDQLLNLQIEGTAMRDDRCIAFKQAFDERLFSWEFEHFIEHGLLGRLATPPPDSELATLRLRFGEMARDLGSQPRVLAHRDYHSWNLFVQNQRLRVIDFQDALLAPAPYDLATLLGDRVTPELIDADLERELLGYYARESWRRGGPQWKDDELWGAYTSSALQKALKVVGRFHYLNDIKGKPGYLRYLPPTLRRISYLLAERPDLAEIGRILEPYFPAMEP